MTSWGTIEFARRSWVFESSSLRESYCCC